tara:strand:+ start:795 stop:1778 length:984 start_codon:yes stop_codon:yes gene_type:complete
MADAQKNYSIGGYLGLQLPLHDEDVMQGMIKTNSARSAIKLVLAAVKAKKIWLPYYICESVINAVRDIGVQIGFYNVNSDFSVDPSLTLSEDEFILVAEYFGIFKNHINDTLHRFGHKRTIVDCSQAYFSKPTAALATVYSPRKFFGLPDGGLIYTCNENIQQPRARDSTSQSRMSHLLKRLIDEPEAGYEDYLEAEHSIAKLPVQGMSYLTERLLKSVDSRQVKQIRTKNAQHVHKYLSEYNQLDFVVDQDTSPLCYPFLPNVKVSSRLDLIKKRVFVPTYWPEVLNRVTKNSYEWNVVTNCLFLPCDQRYSEGEMDRLIGLLAID